jgi:hypothetical protein
MDIFSRTTGANVVRDWTAFWLSSAAGAFAIFLVVALFFQSRSKIESKASAEAG